MSTPAIIEAYKRQVAEDATWMGPYYLSSLKRIAILRGGIDYDTIDRFVRGEYADGKYATEDVECSFSYFGLPFEDPGITDEHILGTFYSHRGSAGQETEARRELWRIGDFRQSERIKAAAEECILSPAVPVPNLDALLLVFTILIFTIGVSNVEQANIYLGVENETPDDFVLTMYTAKVCSMVPPTVKFGTSLHYQHTDQ